ncbi:MAG: 5-bromo-4-chloroindolyl phosphate hydrolysis family protein [Clostridia bacterium]|nr:5-bromo-4-chloroindolyl phosphate hydrolysis family protein [Clostridia bacterium]
MQEIIGGLIGGGVFVFFFFVLHSPFIGIAAALGAYLGINLLLSSKTGSKSGVDTSKAFHSALDDAYAKINEIKASSLNIKNDKVKRDVEQLCIAALSILDDQKKNPMGSQSLINYYLDSTTRIIKKYVELNEVKIRTPEIQSLLEKCENILSSVNQALSKQISSMMEDDISDLDAEISVLEKTLKSEGL